MMLGYATDETPELMPSGSLHCEVFSTEILGEHFVSDATFTVALEELGEQGVVDLIGSLGNFSMLAMLLNTFQVDLQDVEPPFPDVRGFARVPDTQPVPGT